jgi:hypothetical protein
VHIASCASCASHCASFWSHTKSSDISRAARSVVMPLLGSSQSTLRLHCLCHHPDPGGELRILSPALGHCSLS